MKIDRDHAGNVTVLEYLRNKPYDHTNEDCSPDEIEEKGWNLNCTPEIAGILWSDLTVLLPEKCQWVLYGTPVLVNPQSGLIFGFAEGTLPPLLRLGGPDYETALQKGARESLSNLDGVYADAREAGPGWLYCFTFLEGIDALCHSAYKQAFTAI